MILLWGVIFGVLAGVLRAWRNGCNFHPSYSVRGLAVLVIAFLPQLLAFYVPVTRTLTTLRSASVALIASQVLLLIVVWLNRRFWAFWLMGAGLLLNLTVILANGGMMPISPATIVRLSPDFPPERLQTGTRLGYSKDVVLAPESTRFPWLADRFTVPDWYPQRVAFSLGDVLIALGAFGLFWSFGRCPQPVSDD